MAERFASSLTRKPLMFRGERVHGVFVRTTKEGGTVYEARWKTGGRSVRRVLSARTPGDAIREFRSLRAKTDAGGHLVGRTDVTLKELRDAYAVWLDGPTCPLAAGTRAQYLGRLDHHVLPALGETTRATAVTPAHVRTMIDKLSRKSLAGGSIGLCVSAASGLCRFVVRSGVTETNPVRGLERGDRPSGRRLSEPRTSTGRRSPGS